MISIHDNEVLSYTVDLKNKTIRLDTTWSYKERSEHTMVEFRGVFTHYLVGANDYQNVLTDIEEEPLEIFALDNDALLKEWKDTTCWPRLYQDTGDMLRQLGEEKLRYYKLYAAIGLEGWVLARKMELIPLDGQPQEGYDHFDIY